MERMKGSLLESSLTTSIAIPSGNQRVPGKKFTFAVLDLRSGSIRIVFDPTFYGYYEFRLENYLGFVFR
jgi:hypothetical protein